IHYETNDVATREQFIFEKKNWKEMNKDFYANEYIVENVILSTCNRTEIYAVVTNPRSGYESIIKSLSSIFAVETSILKKTFTYKAEDEAIDHLLRVTAGLDAMIVGETEVLGQVKEAFYEAKAAGTTS